VEMHDYEEKYWDEFNKNGFNRLEIKKWNKQLLAA
jgi:hypothetical protein